MIAKIVAFFALVAVAFAAPKPEPSPQLVYSAPAVDVISPYAAVPSVYSAPYVSPYAAAAAYQVSPYAAYPTYFLKK